MFENYMVNRNGCKVVMGGLLMGAVWLTSSSLRLATLAHLDQIVVKQLHSVCQLSNHHFYTTNQRLIKRQVGLQRLHLYPIQNQKRNQETLQETDIFLPVSTDLATSLAGPYKSIKTNKMKASRKHSSHNISLAIKLQPYSEQSFVKL